MKAAFTLSIALLCAACDPVWSLRARVRAADGAPLRQAALAMTCGPADTTRTGRAALSDANGEAMIGGLGWEPPANCAMTIAKPGYRTHRVTFEELCAPKSLDDCDRSQKVDILLPSLAGPVTPGGADGP
jgi:hypothetical protein